jgi:hypothetical protein
MKIVTKDPQRYIDWLQEQLNLKFVSPACSYGIEDNVGTLRAAVVFTDFTGCDCHINLAGRAALGRLALRINATIPFIQLGCRRLTALVSKNNKSMEDLMWRSRLGFRLEGEMRNYYPDGSNATVWGMLKEECPWF